MSEGFNLFVRDRHFRVRVDSEGRLINLGLGFSVQNMDVKEMGVISLW